LMIITDNKINLSFELLLQYIAIFHDNVLDKIIKINNVIFETRINLIQ
jgi:hypothetical protein